MTTKPNLGGDRRVAAALNGKRVGAPPKTGKRMGCVLTMRVSEDVDGFLRAHASVQGVGRTDIVREAISQYIVSKTVL